MKDRIEIAHFAGMYGTVEERDLPPGAAAYAKNLDLVVTVGAFLPLPKDTMTTVTNQIGAQFTKLIDTPGGVGSEAAIYRKTTDGSLRILTALNNTPPTDTSLGVTRSVQDRLGASSDGEAVHMGFGPNAADAYAPVWAGYVGHSLFNEDISLWGNAGNKALDAELTSAAFLVRNDDPNNDFTVYLPDDYAATTPRKYDNEQVIFQKGRRYVYYAAAIYDYTQEAPLQKILSIAPEDSRCWFRDTIRPTTDATPDLINGDIGVSGTGDQTYSDGLYQTAASPKVSGNTEVWADGLKKVKFRLWVRSTEYGSGPDAMNRRVTGVAIYRAEVLGGNEGLPYLIKTISINDSSWSYGAGEPGLGLLVSPATLSCPEGYYYNIQIEDELYATPDDFESRSGYRTTIDHMNLRYGLSSSVDGYHVIGDCWHENLKTVRSYLFRSRPGLFDTFDWTRDYLVLPTAPVALASYQGRLYAFAEGRTYVVNVGSLALEDTWEGIGCLDQRSVIVTDKGMFWCDATNIYHHDGTHLNVIGAPVLRNPYEASAAWENLDTSYTPVAFYHPKFASFIIAAKISTSFVGLMYHVDSGRWVHLTFEVPAGTITSFNGVYYRQDGVPVLSVTGSLASYLYTIFGDTANRRDWSWVGYGMRTAGEAEKYYHAFVDSRYNTPDVYYYENDPTYASPQAWSDTTTVEGVTRGQINSGSAPSWAKVRNFALRMDGSGGAIANQDDARHITLHRRRIGAN